MMVQSTSGLSTRYSTPISNPAIAPPISPPKAPLSKDGVSRKGATATEGGDHDDGAGRVRFAHSREIPLPVTTIPRRPTPTKAISLLFRVRSADPDRTGPIFQANIA